MELGFREWRRAVHVTLREQYTLLREECGTMLGVEREAQETLEALAAEVVACEARFATLQAEVRRPLHLETL